MGGAEIVASLLFPKTFPVCKEVQNLGIVSGSISVFGNFVVPTLLSRPFVPGLSSDGAVLSPPCSPRRWTP